MSMHEIGAHRASQLRKWVLKIRDVQEHEEEIRDSVPTHCLEVLERKRLAIFDELLREAGHRDTDLVQDIARGFDLSGPIPGCREFKPKLTLASMPVRELHRAAPLMREITMANTGSSGDAVLDEALYEATMKEVSKGHCVNATASSVDSVAVHSADTVAAGLCYRLHRDMKCRTHGGVHTRAWDLHKAYKNLPLSTQAKDEAFLSVFNPRANKAELFSQKVLPFGARSSVHGFIRTSFGMWRVGLTLLLLHWSIFVDDYIGAEVPPLAKVFELCVETLFRILDWETSADKDQNELDTTEAKAGFVYLRNTSKRKHELIDLISDILSHGLLTSKECQRLRGRIQFASNQVAGKRAGLAYKALSRHLVRGDPRVGDDLQRSLLFLRDNFLEGPPRILCSNMLHLWHMYVDVACFSVWACDELRSLISPGSGNPIFEYECLAILLGLRTWSGLLRGCNVVVFSDNQGALGAMISGSSDNECGALIVNRTHDLLDTMCVNAWFERVNTASNIADPPSRGADLEGLGKGFEVDALRIAKEALSSWD
ncbi:ubiad1 [Symbiodinium pilosum]|uniref:Ubiad1 protein n=1 Tax=Symbiodinium pilosum TaxID=2952 RepID=A0A812QNF0_SYMPI|nr:ubiad1 [Symbiodinium pilosum]